MRNSLAVCTAALAFALAPAAGAEEPQPEPRDLELEVSASGFYGPISGFVQVPLGGEPGTSSLRRPTLEELGIDDVTYYEVTGRLRWGHAAVLGGYSDTELDGSATLSESLVSHGVAFAAGSPISSTVHLDVGNLGAGWRFELDEGRLALFPKIDVAILDFSYSLNSPGASARRQYRSTAVRLGAEVAYQLGHGFALELDGAASLPIGHTPQLANVTGRIAYHSFPTARVRPTLFLGVAARWLDFEDSQTLSNDIEITAGPLVTGGVALSF
jgi:hypothetical protein